MSGLIEIFGVPLPAHGSDPAKCLGSLAANTVLKVGVGGDVDISRWVTVAIYPEADGNIEYNGVATALEPIYVGQRNTFVIHPNVTQIKLIGTAAVVCGM